MRVLGPKQRWKRLSYNTRTWVAGVLVAAVFVALVGGFASMMVHFDTKEKRNNHERFTQQCEDAGGEVKVITDDAHCFVNDSDIDSWNMP